MHFNVFIRFFRTVFQPSLVLALYIGLGSTGCDDENVTSFVPEIRTSPQVLAFGDVAIGGSHELDLTVIDDGNAPLEFDGFPTTNSDRFTVVSPGEFPVEAGGFTTIRVRFEPNAEQEFDAILTLPASSPLAAIEVALNANGIPPPITLSPGELDFGEVDAGAQVSLDVTVTNESDDELTFPLSIASPAFLVGGEISSEVTLAPLQSKDVQLTFSPPGAGSFEGSLVAEICGPRCGPQVRLVGIGIAPRISATPRPLDFGSVSVGDTQSMDLEISNVGVGTLSISRLELEDPLGYARLSSAFDISSLPLEIEAGDVVLLPLEYSPQQSDGDFRANLVIDSNDPLSPRVAIPIRALTPGASLRLLPSALHFGRLDDGEDRVLDVVLLSTGTDIATLDAMEINGTGANSFELDGLLPTLPLSLAPNESLLLSIRATANATDEENGGAQASISFASSGTSTGAAVVVPMTFTSGTAGCQPRARPDNLPFGNMRVGQGANGRIQIINEGDAPCVLENAIPAIGLPFDPGFVFQTLNLDEIAPGDSGAVQFAYQASTEGASTAVLSLSFVDVENPLLVSSSARGVTGSLVALPPSVSLGPMVEGCVDGEVTVSFVNEGSAGVTVTSAVIDPQMIELELAAISLPRSIAPGGSLSLLVRANPNATSGFYIATIIVDTEELGVVTARVELTIEPSGTRLQEQFTVGETALNQIDVLFVIDNSGSMYDDQEILASNFQRFLDEALSSPVDLQLGVTNTDFYSGFAASGNLLGVPPILTSTMPNISTRFSSRALVGDQGSGIEYGLEAMRRALDGRNSGFLRPNAALSIIIVSDEDDSGSSYDPQFDHSPETYIQFLQSLKAGQFSGAPVLVSAVIHPGVPRYTRVASAFDGVTLDISSPEWGTLLGEIGAATVGLARLFRLSNRPDPTTITVTVDGVASTTWTLDSSGTSILFDEPPPPNSVVVVEYGQLCS